MNIIECEQGTDEWFAARLGKVTGTGFQKVLAKGQGKTRKAYMMQLAAEQLTGFVEPSYTNGAMQWGAEHEPEARACYEAINGLSVLQVGFVEHDDNIGVSPDGLVNEDGVIEIKCPNTTTHIETVLSGKFPSTYKAQVQGVLWVTGRKWCDFISFDPRMKTQRSCVIRVERDQDYIDKLKREVTGFIIELKELIETINSKNPF